MSLFRNISSIAALLFGAALAALLTSAALAFALTLHVVDSRAAIADSAEAAEGKRAQVVRLEAAAALARAGVEKGAALLSLPIPQGGTPDFLAAIEAQSRAAGVSLEVSSVDAAAPKGNTPGSLSLNAQFTGTYAQCVRFLKLVETMPGGVAVRFASLDKADGAQWHGSLALRALSFDTP